MSEAVTFWLDNKKCAGIKSAALGDLVLVFYRNRYYVIQDEAAQTKGGRPLRYSNTSLPAVWKRALRGDVNVPIKAPPEMPSEPVQTLQQEKKKTEKPSMTDKPQAVIPGKSEQPVAPPAKAPKKAAAKQAGQPPVVANCPYCNVRHDIPVDKGKSGKPFFIICSKCTKEFAVRFVQVTQYLAQVAGFK